MNERACSSASLLTRIHVASPCPARWEEMAGDERARFCSGCRKYVYNLSGMSAAQAAALIHEKEGRLCVRFYRRTDGTVLTRDCPVGLARMWRQVLARLSLVASLLLWSVTPWKSPEGTQRRNQVHDRMETKPLRANNRLKDRRSQGTKELLSLLKQQGVFPYTIPDRLSIQLP